MVAHTFAKGIKKGYPTNKRAASKGMRPSRRAGKLNKRVELVRNLITEVAGLTPLEKRLVDILKIGLGNPEKRVYKLAKRRLGTHTRALIKREKVKNLYAQMRAKQASGN
jgi:large subunit ribosomal protein L36e